jgi:hypothetical protein
MDQQPLEPAKSGAGEILTEEAKTKPTSSNQLEGAHPVATHISQPQDTQELTIYAIKKGKGLTNGIFLSLEDCKQFIEGQDGDSTFATFDNVIAAMEYLKDDCCSTLDENAQAQQQEQATPSLSSLDHTPKLINFYKKTQTRVKAENNPFRRPTKAWLKMYDAFKAHKEEKGIDMKATENPALCKWIKQQEIEYKNMQDGKGSSMFQAKIDKLKAIDFKFTYVPTQERYDLLYKFKAETGTFPPPSHPILGKWIEKQRAIASKFVNGDNTSYFDYRLKEFDALGMDFRQIPSAPMTEVEKKCVDFDSNWNTYFDNLLVFKRKHGHLDVKKCEDIGLQEWMQRQHQEYQLIQDEKHSTLGAKRVQQLIDAGFEFQRRPKSIKWEDRVKQLARYKKKHGHLKIPKSNRELGVFVNRTRYEYTKLKGGKPSSLSEERIEQLESMDFVFKAGKKPTVVAKRTWDERFKELQEYRKENDHCLVPQHAGLGEWVHSQRRHYKNLEEGKATTLTPARLLMLSNLGFVFDASRKRGEASANSNFNANSVPQITNHCQPSVHLANASIMTPNDNIRDHIIAVIQSPTQDTLNLQELPNHGFNLNATHYDNNQNNSADASGNFDCRQEHGDIRRS